MEQLGAGASAKATVYCHLRVIGAAGILFLLISAPATAQTLGRLPSNSASETVTYSAGDSKVAIQVRVLGPHDTPLQQQALVSIYAKGESTPVKTASTKSDSQVFFYKLPEAGLYTIEVIVPGYRVEQRNLDYNGMSYTRLDFKMQPNVDNVAASGFTSPLPIPPKAQKHVDKGLTELQAGNLNRSKKELGAASQYAPANSDIAYLLGSVYLRSKDLSSAEVYLTKAIAIDPQNVPALVGLGQLRYQEADFQGAEEALGKAIGLDSKQWLALWLLSDIHLRAGNFDAARREAEDAVQLGKGAADGAEFIDGEALAELGRRDDAVKMLQAFLRDLPSDPNAPAARALTGRLELNAPVQSDTTTAGLPAASDDRSFPVIQVPASKLLVPSWEPPGVDQEKPPLTDGVTCPADQVIAGVGKRVSELVDSVNRIQAKEDVVHQELSTMGRPIMTNRRKFDYLISIAPSDSGLLVIDENRDGVSASSQLAGSVSMFGLADLPLIFHPQMRNDFQMICEGLGRWRDQATWLVYFRQRPDRPERLRSYQTLDGSYTVGLKGRAWISADTYQIVRLEANLMKPIPEVGLGSEEDAIEYGPVPFPEKNLVLWLPAEADIYFYYRHRPFHRHHTFTNYLLFSVSASQKIGQPKIPDQPENPQ